MILLVLQDSRGMTAAHAAAARGHVAVVAFLLDARRLLSQKGFSALQLAVQNSMPALVSQLLALPGCQVDAPDVDGLTSLHWAASKGGLSLLWQLERRTGAGRCSSYDEWWYKLSITGGNELPSSTILADIATINTDPASLFGCLLTLLKIGAPAFPALARR